MAPLVFPTLLEHSLVAALALALVALWRSPVAGGDTWPVSKRVAVATMLGLIPFAAVLIPSLIATVLDLPSSAVLAVVLLPLLGIRGRSGIVAIGVLLLALMPTAEQLANSELVERTFFGVHRVQRIDDVTQLSHGTTVHGWQDMSTSASRRQPLSYYHTEGPAGDLAAIAGSRGDLGVIGLGSGAMAAHARPEQRVVFHEIDPAIVDIARERFTYLADSRGDVEVVLGDGRLTMADVTDRYGLLVIDAFSSDSIPVHLLTVEAMTTYLNAITGDGVIAVHVPNRYLDLVPILKAAVEDLDADAVVNNWDGDAEGGTPAQWVAIARTSDDLAELRQEGWSELPTRQVRWTDQRSDLLSVLQSRSL